MKREKKQMLFILNSCYITNEKRFFYDNCFIDSCRNISQKLQNYSRLIGKETDVKRKRKQH